MPNSEWFSFPNVSVEDVSAFMTDMSTSQEQEQCGCKRCEACKAQDKFLFGSGLGLRDDQRQFSRSISHLVLAFALRSLSSAKTSTSRRRFRRDRCRPMSEAIVAVFTGPHVMRSRPPLSYTGLEQGQSRNRRLTLPASASAGGLSEGSSRGDVMTSVTRLVYKHVHAHVRTRACVKPGGIPNTPVHCTYPSFLWPGLSKQTLLL